MKKIMILISCMMFYQVHATQQVLLKKIFHHITAADGAPESITLGDISLLFLSEPTLTEHKKQQNQQEETISYFFPLAAVSDATTAEMIECVNKTQNKWYKARVEVVKKPLKGIMVHLSYNPAHVGVASQRFDTIVGEKGFAFYFYNKKIVNTLKHPTCVTRIVSNGYVPTIVIDAGHGGSDIGTKGIGILLEKEVTLAVGKQLADALKKKGIRLF